MGFYGSREGGGGEDVRENDEVLCAQISNLRGEDVEFLAFHAYTAFARPSTLCRSWCCIARTPSRLRLGFEHEVKTVTVFGRDQSGVRGGCRTYCVCVIGPGATLKGRPNPFAPTCATGPLWFAYCASYAGSTPAGTTPGPMDWLCDTRTGIMTPKGTRVALCTSRRRRFLRCSD